MNHLEHTQPFSQTGLNLAKWLIVRSRPKWFWVRVPLQSLKLIQLSNEVCVTNKTEDLSLNVFSKVTEINESKKINKKIYYTTGNIDLMGKNVIQINGRIAINVDVGVKNVKYMTKIIFGILLHAVVKMENI